MAVWMIGEAQRSWNRPRRHSIWVPAFAGMSGFVGQAAAAIAAAARRRTISAVFSSRL
jgi:hypothetical protein